MWVLRVKSCRQSQVRRCSFFPSKITLTDIALQALQVCTITAIFLKAVSPSTITGHSSPIASLQKIISDNNRTSSQYVHSHAISLSKCHVCSNISCPYPMHILAGEKCFPHMISTFLTPQFSFSLKQQKNATTNRDRC